MMSLVASDEDLDPHLYSSAYNTYSVVGSLILGFGANTLYDALKDDVLKDESLQWWFFVLGVVAVTYSLPAALTLTVRAAILQRQLALGGPAKRFLRETAYMSMPSVAAMIIATFAWIAQMALLAYDKLGHEQFISLSWAGGFPIVCILICLLHMTTIRLCPCLLFYSTLASVPLVLLKVPHYPNKKAITEWLYGLWDEMSRVLALGLDSLQRSEPSLHKIWQTLSGLFLSMSQTLWRILSILGCSLLIILCCLACLGFLVQLFITLHRKGLLKKKNSGSDADAEEGLLSGADLGEQIPEPETLSANLDSPLMSDLNAPLYEADLSARDLDKEQRELDTQTWSPTNTAFLEELTRRVSDHSDETQTLVDRGLLEVDDLEGEAREQFLANGFEDIYLSILKMDEHRSGYYHYCENNSRLKRMAGVLGALRHLVDNEVITPQAWKLLKKTVVHTDRLLPEPLKPSPKVDTYEYESYLHQVHQEPPQGSSWLLS
eukprot:TRINITY_DN26006_c0_g1_i1.p1 TRINITY_DN26006_c0_g1~~TRINITY_DN26006_c0_g1_i1.p1  ORF type:complete len:491 (-),score=54.91 TRINITY_DN26006_c0_g1_i1:186-1658(-)